MATISDTKEHELFDHKDEFLDEKADIERDDVALEEEEQENSTIESVRAGKNQSNP